MRQPANGRIDCVTPALGRREGRIKLSGGRLLQRRCFNGFAHILSIDVCKRLPQLSHRFGTGKINQLLMHASLGWGKLHGHRQGQDKRGDVSNWAGRRGWYCPLPLEGEQISRALNCTKAFYSIAAAKGFSMKHSRSSPARPSQTRCVRLMLLRPGTRTGGAADLAQTSAQKD